MQNSEWSLIKAFHVLDRELESLRRARNNCHIYLGMKFEEYDSDIVVFKRFLRKMIKPLNRGENMTNSVTRYCNSGAVRRLAAMQSIASVWKTYSPEEIKKIVGEANPFEISKEKMQEYTKNGRNITNFGVNNRAKQLVARPIIRINNAKYTDYANIGPRSAVLEIKNILDSGYNHIIVADVVKCYDNINVRELNGLLPSIFLRGKLLETILGNSNHIRCRSSGSCHEEEEVYSKVNKRTIPYIGYIYMKNESELNYPDGIPTGSLISTDVALVAIASKLETVLNTSSHQESKGKVVLYRDDFIIAFPSKDQADKAMNRLKVVFGDRPGSVRLKLEYVNAEKKRFDFAGYRFGKNKIGMSTKTEAKALTKYLEKAVADLPPSEEYLKRCDKGGISRKSVHSTDEYLESLLGGYRWLDEFKFIQYRLVEQLVPLAHTHHFENGLSIEQAVTQARASGKDFGDISEYAPSGWLRKRYKPKKALPPPKLSSLHKPKLSSLVVPWATERHRVA